MARLSFRCDEDLVAAVDRARGDVARERWLRRAVEQALGAVAPNESPSSNAAVQNANRPAPAEQPQSKGTMEFNERGEMTRFSGTYAPRRHSATCRCGVCVPEKKK